MVATRWTDPLYLRHQYADSEQLRIRRETHERYTVYDEATTTDPFTAGLLAHLNLRPGVTVLDVGCGPGTVHSLLRGARILGLDTSFGMLREARRIGCECINADAQALPLLDACVDRVMANHMLFHVADKLRALGEMRRVLRPGGRVVLTTNGAEFLPRLEELHARAAREAGYIPEVGATHGFTLDDLDLVQRVFPNAQRQVLRGALVCPDAEPVLRYYASSAVNRIKDQPPEAGHRGVLLARMRQLVDEIVASEGVFRDPKSVGWFTADV